MFRTLRCVPSYGIQFPETAAPTIGVSFYHGLSFARSSGAPVEDLGGDGRDGRSARKATGANCTNKNAHARSTRLPRLQIESVVFGLSEATDF